MATRKPQPRRTQNCKSNVSLHPLTHDEVLAAALRVDPAELKKLEAQEQAAKVKRKPKGKK